MPAIHSIDLHFQGVPHAIAAHLVECGPAELALVETGPGSTLPALLDGIKALGKDPDHVRHVLVTHVHLDHAGAAGWWAARGAAIYAHPNAAPHLLDPFRLLASAGLVYGERMNALWGSMPPVPAERLQVLRDGESIAAGSATFTALDTPGHARHHHAFALDDVCFTGDVAGIRLPGWDYLSVAAAPPQFDPPAYLQSIDKLASAGFRALYLAHFGVVHDVAGHWQQERIRVNEVHQTVRRLWQQGLRNQALRDAYTEAERSTALSRGLSEEAWLRYQTANPAWMCADGIALYCAKNPGAAASPPSTTAGI